MGPQYVEFNTVIASENSLSMSGNVVGYIEGAPAVIRALHVNNNILISNLNSAYRVASSAYLFLTGPQGSGDGTLTLLDINDNAFDPSGSFGCTHLGANVNGTGIKAIRQRGNWDLLDGSAVVLNASCHGQTH